MKTAALMGGRFLFLREFLMHWDREDIMNSSKIILRINAANPRVTMKTSMKKSRVEKGARAEKPPQLCVVGKNETAKTSATGWRGISRVNLGGIAKTGESRKTEKYPTLPDPDGTVAGHVDQLIELQAQLDQTEGAIKLIKADLVATARPFYFTYCNGKADVPSSVVALNDGGEALINFQNRYSGLEDDSQLVAILGSETSRYFCETFEIKIEGGAIPQENAQPLINGETIGTSVSCGRRSEPRFRVAGLHPRLAFQNALEFTFNQLVVDAETLGRIRALRDADSFDADCHPARAQVDFACHGPLVLPP